MTRTLDGLDLLAPEHFRHLQLLRKDERRERPRYPMPRFLVSAG
jgi:hypothetical protein